MKFGTVLHVTPLTICHFRQNRRSNASRDKVLPYLLHLTFRLGYNAGPGDVHKTVSSDTPTQNTRSQPTRNVRSTVNDFISSISTFLVANWIEISVRRHLRGSV